MNVDNLLLLIISTTLTSLSCCFLAAFKPRTRSLRNSLNKSESGPPMTSTNSGVSLKGDCSKPIKEIL